MDAPIFEMPGWGLAALPGEIVAVSGPGGGALWRLAAGAEPGPAGSVLYKGRDVSAWTAQRRRKAGLLALFAGPAVPAGMTLTQLARLSAGAAQARGMRQALRRAAEQAGLPADLPEAPLDGPGWSGKAGAAEWVLAACLKPELVISAAAVAAATAPLASALAQAGCALVLTGSCAGLPRARKILAP